MIVLVVVHVLMAVAHLAPHTYGTDALSFKSDINRYLALGDAHGVPGRDFTAEYPPLAILGMRAMAGHGLRTLAIRNGIAQLVADLTIAGVVFAVAGEIGALLYLGIGVMMLPFLLGEFELTAVALALLGVFLARRAPRTGGLLVAASVFVKPFGVLLVPVFALQRRWRALVSTVTGIAVGGVAWIAWSGLKGPIDVATFRGSRGWHTESTPGWLLGLLHTRSHYEGGAWRIGAPPSFVSFALTAATLGAVAVWWWSCRSLRTHADDLAPLGALLLWFSLATLFSPQFVAWLLPFAAIALARGLRRSAAAATAVVVLTWIRIEAIRTVRPDGFGARLMLGVRIVALAIAVWAVVADRRELAVRDADDAETAGAPEALAATP